MPASKRQPQPEAVLHVSAPELWRFEFIKHEGTSPDFDWENIPLSFNLGLSRFSTEQLGVELSIEIDIPITYVIVVYRATFEIEMLDSDPDDLERELRVVAAQVAPSTLYPFIRETVTTTSVKAGLPPLVPPIINFRSLFDPTSIDLPTPPTNE